MSGIGAALTVLFCVAVIASPRRLAVLAYIAAALFITQGQAVNLGGLNFMAIRFVEVAAFIRVIARGEFSFSRFTSVDRWLLIFFVTSLFVMTLRIGDLDKYALGVAVDGCLVFFTFRALIFDFDEFNAFMKGLVCLLIPMALLMMVESSTGRNMFSVMGGVPEMSTFPRWPLPRAGRFPTLDYRRNCGGDLSTAVHRFPIRQNEAALGRHRCSVVSRDRYCFPFERTTHGRSNRDCRMVLLAFAPQYAPDPMGHCRRACLPCI